MKNFVAAFLLIFFFNTKHSYSQVHKYCGHDMISKDLRSKVPDYDEKFFSMVKSALSQAKLTKQAEQDVYVIQVVVHILYERNNKYQNIPDSIIISQIDALNRDFRKRNSDTSNIRDVFKDIAADVGISFELAKRDPQNQSTTGITRKRWNGTTATGPFADPFIKTTLLGGQSPWNTARYLNIWVIDLNKNPIVQGGFLAGYAYPPPGLPEWPPVSLGNPQTDGVVVDYRFFGDNNHVARDNIEPVAVANSKGRTTVHEVGHYLGLRHVWGDLGTLLPELGCQVDDGIDDTPNAQVPTGGGICFVNPTLNSCIEAVDDKPDMYENYMDYSGDLCNAMFTKEQSDLMRWVLFNRRKNIILSNIEANPLVTSQTACKGDTVKLAFGNLRDDYKYSWNGERDIAEIEFIFDKDTLIEVEVSNAFNTKVFNFEINANPGQVISDIANFSFEIDSENRVSFTPANLLQTTYLWDLGDGTTSDEQNPEHLYDEKGIYTVRLSIPNESSCDTFIFEENLEIENTLTSNYDLQVKYGIQLFPNPTNSELNVRFGKQNALHHRFRVFDVSGKVLLENIHYSQNDWIKVPVRQLSSGYYFIEIENNNEFIRLPFVKE